MLNPILSEYTKLNCAFDFNQIHIYLPRKRKLVHDRNQNRDTWDPHGHKCWYVWIDILHYRCLTSYTPKTAKERLFKKIEFFPESLPLPRISSEEEAIIAEVDIAYALLNPTPNIPLTTLGIKHTIYLKQLADIFNMNVPPQATPTVTRVLTQQEAPAPHPRVDPPGNI